MNPKAQSLCTGLAQMTLLEHSLCPLDSAVSLQPGYTHHTRFAYSKAGTRCTGQAALHLPLGLSASDEFTLWGLLALTLRQPDADAHFMATPHYCLRQLGLINAGSRRGGRNYERFRETLKRLAAASYQCDSFYDPERGEHCQVAFGFLSYRLPHDPQSNRLWNFYWDPVFYSMCGRDGGRLAFDLDLYRQLDPASRRLFLLLHKVFYRKPVSPVFDVRRLCEDLLGFSSTLSNGALNRKLQTIIGRLQAQAIIDDNFQQPLIRATQDRSYVVQFRQGAYFRNRSRAPERLDVQSSSLTDALASLGFESRDAGRLQRRYAGSLLKEWIEITQAAINLGKIHRSPQAFLVDNLKHAAAGSRTAPDWWQIMRKQADRSLDQQHWGTLKRQLRFQEATMADSTQHPTGPQRIGEILGN